MHLNLLLLANLQGWSYSSVSYCQKYYFLQAWQKKTLSFVCFANLISFDVIHVPGILKSICLNIPLRRNKLRNFERMIHQNCKRADELTPLFCKSESVTFLFCKLIQHERHRLVCSHCWLGLCQGYGGSCYSWPVPIALFIYVSNSLSLAHTHALYWRPHFWNLPLS